MARTRRVPGLAEGEVHAWRFALGGVHAGDACGVDEDDLARAQRFVFERDRARFLRARFVMRELLSAYAGGEPREHAILYGEHGKPHVDARLGIAFNMSHSGDLGLIAFARGVEVGVDIEEIAPREGMRALAATVMSPGEQAAIRGLADAALCVPFLTCWTRKEACLKALGVGLSVEPRTVSVGIRATRSRVSVSTPRPVEVDVASLFQDELSVGALAVAGGYDRARLLDWAA